MSAFLDIIVYPDAVLKQVAEPVLVFDEQLRVFLDNLESTLDQAPGCVGIAAPQVGVLKRIVIVDVSGKPKLKNHGRLILINPEITDWEGHEVGREGCLSIPDYTGNVVRASSIVLEALDASGCPCRYEMEGYEARVAQHELDHLEGVLFLDRLVSRRSDLFKRKSYQGKKKAS